MSYSRIFRRIGRLFQSTVHSILDDEDKRDANAFDEELRREQEREKDQRSSSSQQEQRQSKQQARSEGKRKPGEREDAYYYEVLGLTPSATEDEIRQAYRKLMMQYHPDKVATLGPELRQTASEKSKAINEAYMIIERRRGMK